MVEQYAIPAKKHIENSETDRQTKRLNDLIQQVKQDVSLNQSKIGRSKCGGMSMTQDVANVTNESQMPNVTNEELHISQMVTKVPQNGGSQQPQSELHKLHLLQTLQSLQYLKNLRKPEATELLAKTVYLPPPRNPACKKTLIFDLDETLIHCVDDIAADPPDVVLPVTFPNGEVVDAGVNIRPGAVECLKEVNKSFQVVVFTASHKFYADVVLDHLDPTGELIQYRLYRDSCYQTADGVYVKDLRIIKNRQLKDLVIVDNAVYSFGFQLDNGIPIIPFYNNPEDEELLHLVNYINCLAHFEDIREQNARAFQLRELESTDLSEYLDYFFNQNKEQPQQTQSSESLTQTSYQSETNCRVQLHQEHVGAIQEEENEETDEEDSRIEKRKSGFEKESKP